jgi:hypothetical protein
MPMTTSISISVNAPASNAHAELHDLTARRGSR